MRVDCEGCAGCCLDWRAIAPDDLDLDHERRGSYRPIDDTYNLVVLTRDDVRGFLDAGLADAMTARLFHAPTGPDGTDAVDEGDGATGADARSVTIDGYDLAAIDGRPVFFVGLRKVAKPVAPFGTAGEWLPACAFLDPATLQCRLHDTDRYPADCAAYPGHNLVLGAASECERVESGFGGDRLLDDEPPADPSGLLLGPQAVGQKLFVHPDPESLDGVVEAVAAGDLARADRDRFVAAAAASAPGTTEIDDAHYESALDAARGADSWVGRAIADWEARAAARPPDPGDARAVEDARGAPPTPGWDG